jgi:hypothetical protein
MIINLSLLIGVVAIFAVFNTMTHHQMNWDIFFCANIVINHDQ